MPKGEHFKKDHGKLEGLETLIREQQIFLKSILRKASTRWKYRRLAKNRAKVGQNLFVCELCKKLYEPHMIQLDHIKPVIPITGWDDWNGYIERLFCYIDGYQVACKNCHHEKTNEENKGRKPHAARKRKLKKNDL